MTHFPVQAPHSSDQGKPRGPGNEHHYEAQGNPTLPSLGGSGNHNLGNVQVTFLGEQTLFSPLDTIYHLSARGQLVAVPAGRGHFATSWGCEAGIGLHVTGERRSPGASAGAALHPFVQGPVEIFRLKMEGRREFWNSLYFALLSLHRTKNFYKNSRYLSDWPVRPHRALKCYCSPEELFPPKQATMAPLP